MKYQGKLTVLAGCLTLLLGTANAQNPARDANDPTASEEYSASLRYRDYLQGADLRAGEIVGAPVRNMEGEDLGEIEELVIGANEQMLVMLSIGGFLGVGEKRIAVPYDELRVSPDGDTFYVNRSRSTLESEPSYAYRERAGAADADLTAQSRSAQDRTAAADTDEGPDRTAQRRAQPEDRPASSTRETTTRETTTVARDRPAAAGADEEVLSADEYRASAIIGAAVVDSVGEDVGEIDDLVVSSDSDEIQAVISVGGVAGIGAKLVAVPFDDLQIAPGGESADAAPRLRIDMSAEQVRDSLPEFNYERQLAQGSATNPRG